MPISAESWSLVGWRQYDDAKGQGSVSSRRQENLTLEGGDRHRSVKLGWHDLQ